MIKVGLIGTGFMGGMHYACYKALADLGVKVTAIADAYKESAEKLSGGECEIYDSGKELIEHADVDVIDICLPTPLHAEHAVLAMKRKLAVFCEKPVAFQEEDLKLMLQTQKETNAVVMIGHVIRFWPEYVWLKEVVEKGTYGKLLSAVFKRVSSKPLWAKDDWIHKLKLSGGVALDMHIHDVDFVRYLLGDPDKIQSSAYRNQQGGIEQIFSLYNYGPDVAVSLEAGWNFPKSFPFKATYQIKLEKASIIYDEKIMVYPDEGEPYSPEIQGEFVDAQDVGGNISSLGGYYNELKYFIQGLKGENDLSRATLAEGVASVRLVKKEMEAAGGLFI